METNSQNQDQIVDELRQLCSQYLNEVPSRRRAWPKSIKERVLRLLQMDLSCEAVSRAAGISAATIYGWKAQTAPAQFLPVKVVATRVVTTAPIGSQSERTRRRYSKREIPTIIVIAPGGLRFEGLGVREAIEIARALGIGQAP